MTRDAMLFLPAKVVEGLLVIGCSSLYSHIFVEGAVSAFNLTNTTIQLLYLILAGWMANSATRYVGRSTAPMKDAACSPRFLPSMWDCACSLPLAAALRQL